MEKNTITTLVIIGIVGIGAAIYFTQSGDGDDNGGAEGDGDNGSMDGGDDSGSMDGEGGDGGTDSGSMDDGGTGEGSDEGSMDGDDGSSDCTFFVRHTQIDVNEFTVNGRVQLSGPIEGASVTVDLFRNGKFARSATATTDANGLAVFDELTRDPGEAGWKIVVSSAEKSGCTRDTTADEDLQSQGKYRPPDEE